MKELTSILEKLKYSDIKTYIQSGNVICKGLAAPDKNIGKAIKQQFGFEPPVLILNPAELQSALAKNPYKANKDGKAVHFFFCREKPKAAVMKTLQQYQAPSEEYNLSGKVLYLHAPEGIARSKLASKIDKNIGTTVTARNLNTVKKIAALLEI